MSNLKRFLVVQNFRRTLKIGYVSSALIKIHAKMKWENKIDVVVFIDEDDAEM